VRQQRHYTSTRNLRKIAIAAAKEKPASRKSAGVWEMGMFDQEQVIGCDTGKTKTRPSLQRTKSPSLAAGS
jgi:hypothetical protein